MLAQWYLFSGITTMQNLLRETHFIFLKSWSSIIFFRNAQKTTSSLACLQRKFFFFRKPLLLQIFLLPKRYLLPFIQTMQNLFRITCTRTSSLAWLHRKFFLRIALLLKIFSQPFLLPKCLQNDIFCQPFQQCRILRSDQGEIWFEIRMPRSKAYRKKSRARQN